MVRRHSGLYGARRRVLHLLRDPALAPLFRPLMLLASVWVIGTFGFFILGRGQYSLLDCAFMTAITLTTVGYNDTLGISDTDLGRFYVIALLVFGMGVTLYSVSSVTAFIVEGNLRRLFRERRMQKRIDALRGHYILCGAGETGVHVLHELIAAEVPFVVVDQSAEVCERVAEQIEGELLTIEGDATDEKALEAAGIEHARGLVAALTEDKANLFLVVTARSHKDLRIVAKCLDHDSVSKFMRAGADHVVSPTYIGGLRIASQLLRPNVVNFLDNMLRGRDKSIRVDEVEVPAGSAAIGKTLRDLRIGERTGMLVIAVKDPGRSEFDYNPGGDRGLQEGSLLVVIGRRVEAEKLRELVRDGSN